LAGTIPNEKGGLYKNFRRFRRGRGRLVKEKTTLDPFNRTEGAEGEGSYGSRGQIIEAYARGTASSRNRMKFIKRNSVRRVIHMQNKTHGEIFIAGPSFGE